MIVVYDLSPIMPKPYDPRDPEVMESKLRARLDQRQQRADILVQLFSAADGGNEEGLFARKLREFYRDDPAILYHLPCAARLRAAELVRGGR